LAEHSVDQFERAFGVAERGLEEAIQQCSRGVEAIVECGIVLIRGVQDISGEWSGWAHERHLRYLNSFDALLRSRTPQDLIAAQSDLMGGNLELFLDKSRRVAERSLRLAEEVAQRVTADEIRRAA
jgi:hypothetical protein